jgi:pilus assembly protein CpaC
MEGAEPLLTGTLLRFSDWLEIAELARRHRGRYRFAARALEDVGDKAIARFRKLAEDHGFPILRFSADPQFTIHVPAASADLKEGIEEVFAPFGMTVKSNSAAISIQPLIKTQVILAEVSRSEGQIFGVEWPSSYQAQLMPRFGKGTDNYMLTLKALAQSGQAQILASPNLLCRSGGEAHFLAGGEFPVPVIGRHSKSVIWKQHGVILNVKPKADFQGAISLEIETEVSLVDMAHAVEGVPALKTNKVKSHFDLAGKRTIALSGLLRQELGRNQEGLPLLSEIPILGPLFSSRNFQSQQSELVIFVTPEVHTPEADTPIEMPKGWIRHEW